jgi:hypothetical protein
MVDLVMGLSSNWLVVDMIAIIVHLVIVKSKIMNIDQVLLEKAEVAVGLGDCCTSCYLAVVFSGEALQGYLVFSLGSLPVGKMGFDSLQEHSSMTTSFLLIPQVYGYGGG